VQTPLRLLAVALLASASACSDAVPCSTCPAVGGTYALTWDDPVTVVCPVVGPSPASLSITQMGSALSAIIDGVPLTGTLYDTYDLTLAGGTIDLRYTLKARAVVTTLLVAPDGGADAGSPAKVHLEGNLMTTSTDAGCQGRGDFFGDRAP